MDMTPLSSISNFDAMSAFSQTREPSSDMGKTEFMQLLVAQLQNQDPMSPADPQDFAAQLAQFSTLEQMINMNKSMDLLTSLQSSMNSTQAAAFLNHDVKALGQSIHLNGGKSSTINFDLADSAQQVTVEIFNKNGTRVQTLELGSRGVGPQQVQWDGLNTVGNPAEDGDYTFVVSAADRQGNAVHANTYTSGPVQGLVFDNGVTYLKVGGGYITISDILEVY